MAPSIFRPGDVCAGSYVIERLYARSRAAETYLARRTATRQAVLLTCTRFPSGSPLQASFLANASKLTALTVEDAPRVLSADVTHGVSWIVREHEEDAVPLWELLTSPNLKVPSHIALQKGLSAIPSDIYRMLILATGVRATEILGEYSKHGVYHGGLDLKRTLALGSNGEPLVLDTGYRLLFGPEHVEYAPDEPQLTAPELYLGYEVSARTDIYTLGVALQSILTQGAYKYNFAVPERLILLLSRLYQLDPNKRVQRWEDVLALFDEYINGSKDSEPAESGRVTAPSSESPSAPETTPRLSKMLLDLAPWVVSASPPVANDVAPPLSSPSESVVVDEAPATVRVVAPLADPVVMPVEPSLPPPTVPSIEPPTPVHEGGRTNERTPPRSIRWAVPAFVAVLIGLAAFRAAPLHEPRVPDAPSGIEGGRRWLTVPERSVDRDVALPRSLDPASDRTVGDAESKKSQLPTANNTRSACDWWVSLRAVKSFWKAEEKEE